MLDTTGVRRSIAEALARPSLGDLVYERLLRAILSGELKSGSTINVRALAKELGVSRIPIRDALLRLVAEGLVNNSDTRVATVARFAQREAADIFQVREVLESAAARLAATRITNDQLAELEHIAAELSRQIGRSEAQALAYELESRFHLTIAEAAGNDAMRAEIQRFNQRVWIVQLVRLVPNPASPSEKEHRRILDALRNRDPDAAQAAMTSHIRSSLERLLARWDSRNEHAAGAVRSRAK